MLGSAAVSVRLDGSERPSQVKRILFCSPVLLDPRLGAGKHWLELADSFRGLGWEAEAVGPEEIAGGPIRVTHEIFPRVLRDFLLRTAADYDVVEYEHYYLPYPRSDFAPGPLFVARCMLLHHHFLTTPLPPAPGLQSWLRHALNGAAEATVAQRVVAQTDATVRQADLTVVSNDRDATALIRNGADPERIAVFPLGMTAERLRQFVAAPDGLPERPVVGFVGTFDPRKGMCEFPNLVDRVTRRVPGVTFRLLGTAGLVRDADGVRHTSHGGYGLGWRSTRGTTQTNCPASWPEFRSGCSRPGWRASDSGCWRCWPRRSR